MAASKDADPVAARSGFLCTYMSNHPDTLVAYAAHFGHVRAPMASAKLDRIEAEAMYLTYKLAADGKEGSVRVAFDPPLLGYEEVRPRLTAMKHEAEDALGMKTVPPLSAVSFPPRGLLTLLLLAVLAIVHYAPEPYTATAHHIRASIPCGATCVAWLWRVMIATNALEALYAAWIVRRTRATTQVATLWILSVAVAGYPVLMALRHTVQQIRIEAVQKAQRAH